MSKRAEAYRDGMYMGDFERIVSISSYNHNYYIGRYNHLLFEKSDDDNTSQWWILCGTDKYLLGYSLSSDGDKLIKTDKVWT